MKRVGIAAAVGGLILALVLLLRSPESSEPQRATRPAMSSERTLALKPLSSSEQALLDSLLEDDIEPRQLSAWLAQHHLTFYSIFDRLQSQTALEKHQGQDSAAAASFARAEKVAKAFSDNVSDSLLLLDLRFLASLSTTELKTKLEAEALLEQARVHFRAARDSLSLQYYQQAYRLFRSIGDQWATVKTLYGIGDLLSRGHDADRAWQYLRRAQARAKELGDLLTTMRVLFRMGQLHYLASEYQEAEQNFQAALALADTLQSLRHRARILNRLGRIARRRGDFPQALARFRSALALQEKLGDRSGLAVTSTSIGLTYKDMANYTAAIKFYRRAYQLHREVENPLNAARALANLGNLYVFLGDLEQARNFLQQSLAIKRSLANRLETAITLANLGEVEFRIGNYEAAYTSLTDALAAVQDQAYRQKRGDFLLQLGEMYRNRGQYNDAIAAYSEALALHKTSDSRAGVAEAQTGLGFCYLSLGDVDRAQQRFREAFRIGMAIGSPRLQWRAHYGLALVRLRQQETREAEAHLAQAITVVEKTRARLERDEWKVSFFAREQKVYDEMILLQIDRLRDPGRAFEYSERARARSLLDLFQGQIEVVFGDSIPGPLRQLTPELRSPVAAATFSLRDIQRRLPSSAGLVEYRLTEKELAIWWVTQTAVEVFRRPIERSNLSEQIRAFRRAIGADDFEAFKTAFETDPQHSYQTVLTLGRKLARTLVDPVLERLKTRDLVYFVPDGELFYLPFATLVVEDETGTQRFLDDLTTIAMVPSANVLARLIDRTPERRPVPERVLVVANPILPGATAESRALQDLFLDVVVLTGDTADKLEILRALQDKFDVVHFATHGIVDEVSPLQSSLILRGQGSSPQGSAIPSEESGENDRLVMHEIFSLRFPADPLVVLAACETALGRSVAGEGLIGLTQAFFYAGASSLVTSLWRVDDRYAQKLMLPFYEALRASSTPPAVALRQARAQLRSKLEEDPWIGVPHPYFWAAFIFVGQEPVQPGRVAAVL